MAKCCGPKAVTKKIKVGNCEVPIRGLEPIMFMAFKLNLTEDEQILGRLIKEITELGNIIPSEKEKDFKNSLLLEYRKFVNKILSNRKNKSFRNDDK